MQVSSRTILLLLTYCLLMFTYCTYVVYLLYILVYSLLYKRRYSPKIVFVTLRKYIKKRQLQQRRRGMAAARERRQRPAREVRTRGSCEPGESFFTGSPHWGDAEGAFLMHWYFFCYELYSRQKYRNLPIQYVGRPLWYFV